MKQKRLAFIISLCLVLVMQMATPAVSAAIVGVEYSEMQALLVEKSAMAQQLPELRQQQPGLDYVANEVIVSVTNEAEAESIAAAYGATLVACSEQGLAVLELDAGQTVISAVADGASTANTLPVVYPNLLYELNDAVVSSTPNDPYIDDQYYHQQLGDYLAWDITTGSAAVVVAVIDTGVNSSHPDLIGKISPLSYNTETNAVGLSAVTDDLGHGSHVAGTIVAAQNNGVGVSGIAPGVTLIAIKANDPLNPGNFSSASLIEAINYAVDAGADIINMSLGRDYDNGPYSPELTAIQHAASHDVLIVCAAGNAEPGYAPDDHASYPAAYDECIAVAAVNENGTYETDYSYYGPEIDIAAPGSSIKSTVYDTSNEPDSMYKYYSGTSMATPVVCAVAALIKSQNPSLTAIQIKTKLYSSAIDKGSAGFDIYYGNGMLNTLNALSSSYFAVTFNSQGGSAVPGYQMAAGSYLTAPVAPTQAGATFGGWYTNAACTAGNIWVFSMYNTQAMADVVTTNLTLYAKWTYQQVTVSFNSQGGTAVAPISTNYNTTITLPAAPTRTGHQFASWNTAASGSGAAFTASTPVTGNLTVYAQWVINTYNVTFLSWDGSTLAEQTVNYGSAASAPAAPSREFYDFVGWDTPFDVVASDLVITAQYAATPLHTTAGSTLLADQTTSVISGLATGTSLATLLSNIENPGSQIEIRTAAGTLITDTNQPLATGMVVNLILDGVLRDQLIVAVKGDVNGDGKISVADLLMVKKQLLGQIVLHPANSQAAKVSDNNRISVMDLLKLKKHLLGQIVIQ